MTPQHWECAALNYFVEIIAVQELGKLIISTTVPRRSEAAFLLLDVFLISNMCCFPCIAHTILDKLQLSCEEWGYYIACQIWCFYFFSLPFLLHLSYFIFCTTSCFRQGFVSPVKRCIYCTCQNTDFFGDGVSACINSFSSLAKVWFNVYFISVVYNCFLIHRENIVRLQTMPNVAVLV